MKQEIRLEFLRVEFQRKIVPNYKKLKKIREGFQNLGQSVVVTIGSWDVLHIGHVRYLNRAKTYGDILIVGTDSDRAIKSYKGPQRPLVPEEERMEMLSYQTSIDFITLVDDVTKSGKWLYGLIKTLRPDVFVAVEDSYPDEQRLAIQKFCGELVVLPRQAENTSTTHLIQETIKRDLVDKLKKPGRD